MRPLPPRRTAAALAALSLLFATPVMATNDTSGPDAEVQWAPVEPDPGQVEAGSPTLNLEDAQRVSGTHTIVSSPSTPGANPTEIRVNGTAATGARQTLGSEYLAETDSALVLDVTAAIEIAYSNYLLVNGERVAILEQIAHVNDHPINIPAELLTTGHNSIEFWTGTRASTCGINHDDVVIGNFRLQGPDGTQYTNPDNPITGPQPGADGLYNIGDGNCGSSNKPRHLTLSFDVDAEPGDNSGLLLELDTTELEDGTHTVTAAAGSAETTTEIIVDNTGPALASSVPAEGDEVLGEVTIDATLVDDAGLAGTPTLTLDGNPVNIGDTLSSDEMAAGDHELRIEATDELGNTSVHLVSFTTHPNTPVFSDLAPVSGTSGTDGTVTLSATVTDPHGGDVETTFYEATPRMPEMAAQGTTPSLPLNQLNFTGQEEVATDGLAPGDDQVLRSPAADRITFQRFDIPVDDSATDQVISWSGEVDPARGARLYVWDADEQIWQLLQDSRGTAEGLTELTGIAQPNHISDNTVHLLVEGYDPFTDDIGGEVTEEFRDPDTYDFAIAHNTDTQYLSEGAVDQEGAAAERFRDAYLDTTQWIVDNADERKIAYALHTGDLVNDDTVITNDPEWLAHARDQYAVADEAQAILDDAGIPNGVLPGNHDNKYGTDNSLYNEYFGPERYEALSDSWENAEYGGPWKPGDNQNHYDLFSASGQDFIVVHLGYMATDEELAWANEILGRYPDRNAILASHEYINASTAPDARGSSHTAHWGEGIYEKVVSNNPNIFLVLSGHVHGVGTNVRHNVARDGHHVVELLADYQEYLVDGEKTAGYMRLLQFDVDRSEMSVNTYSARLDDHGAHEYDSATNREYDGSEDEFTVPVDLNSRTTSIATDSVLVTAYSDNEIGSDTAASGDSAETEWADLEPGTTYGWYAVAENATDGIGTSPLSIFTVAGSPEEPVDPTPIPDAEGKVYLLSNSWDSPTHDTAFAFGRADDDVFVGDWDGDGEDTLAVRRGHTFYVNNELIGGIAEAEFAYGRDGDIVLVGDWDGDGKDTFAVRRGDRYFVSNELVGGNADTEFAYGRDADTVLVGDWDGDSEDTLAVRRGHTIYVNNELIGGNADTEFAYGRDADTVIAGDWDGDGSDSFGIRRGNEFHLRNTLEGGVADLTIRYGRESDIVLIGDWDGNGTDTPGVRR